MKQFLALLVAIGLVSLMATGATAAIVHANGNVAVSLGNPHGGGNSPTMPPEAAVSDGDTSVWHSAPGNTCSGCVWQLDLGEDLDITQVYWYNYANTQNSARTTSVAFATESEASGTLGTMTGFSNPTQLDHTVFEPAQEAFPVVDTARYVELTFISTNGGTIAGFGEIQFEGEEVSNTGPPEQFNSWREDTSGDWNAESSWSGGGSPPSGSQIAVLGNVISTPQTVFTNSAVTVNGVQFNSGQRYVVAGAGSINLATGTSFGSLAPTIQVMDGTHEFQAPVTILNDTSVDVASGNKLSFDNTLTLSGNALSKIGDGTIEINHLLGAGGGIINCLQGTCSGSGTVGGDLNNDGGTVSPGNSTGSLAVPEPTGFVLLLGAMMGILRLRVRPGS